jgi:hypothetical protein
MPLPVAGLSSCLERAGEGEALDTASGKDAVGLHRLTVAQTAPRVNRVPQLWQNGHQ